MFDNPRVLIKKSSSVLPHSPLRFIRLALARDIPNMENSTSDCESFMANSSVVGNLSFETSSPEVNIRDNDFPLMMECISYVMICVALFGLPGNILTIIIYVKIGLSESINISTCALGVSDILAVSFITWNAICFIPAFLQLDVRFIPSEIVVFTGGATSEMFGATTAWVTAYISCERCLCVVFPLKIRHIITRQRSVLIIITIFTINIVSSLTTYLTVYNFVVTYDVEKNKTVLGLKLTNSSEADALYNFNFVFSSVFMNLLPLAFILVFSITLVIHMKRNALWRLQAANETVNPTNINSSDNRAQRKYMADMRVSKTVLTVSVASCILGFLYAVRSLMAAVVPGFQPMQTYGAEYKLSSRLLLLVSEINSSMNFAIYYKMGSKFRGTLRHLLRLKESGNT